MRIKLLSVVAILSQCVSLYGTDFKADFSKLDTQFSKADNVKIVDTPFGKGALLNEYNSNLELKDKPNYGKDFGVSMWVSPRMYPMSATAIANSIDKDRGWYVGINKLGAPEVRYTCGGYPTKLLESNAKIPLLKWTHIAALFEEGKFVRIFVNGKEVAKKSLAKKTSPYYKLPTSFDFSDSPIEIGRTQIPLSVKTSAGIAKHAGLKSHFRFDGIVADFKISDVEAFEKILDEVKKSSQIDKDSGLKFTQLPACDVKTGKFGAYHTKLKYDCAWDSLWRVDSHPDVVVRFPDLPVKYIFWRGMGYVPVWATENNIWLTDQSVENFRGGECSEVMSDKQCRYSHVRVIENGEARVVIHWRYAMTNVINEIRDEDETGWGEWVDEYFTIYPDSIGIRKQILHSSNYEKCKQWGYQFQETIMINSAGKSPEDNLEKMAITFANLDGETASYSWDNGTPKFDKPNPRPIQIVNTNSTYKNFSIYEPTRITTAFPVREMWSPQTRYHCKNHYPVTQAKNDGQRFRAGIDRPTHTSLAETTCALQKYEKIAENSYAVRQMFGMTNEKIETLIPLAKSWNFAPKAKSNTSAQPKYDLYSRAYELSLVDDNSSVELTFEALKESPLYNCAIVIKNFDATAPKVFVDGKELVRGKDFYFSRADEIDSSKSVFFLRIKSEKSTVIKIEK